MSAGDLPKLLLRIRADDPKFAQAYGGTVVLYWRPAMVMGIVCDEDGNAVGFWYAPFTSSLDTYKVSCITGLLDN